MPSLGKPPNSIDLNQVVCWSVCVLFYSILREYTDLLLDIFVERDYSTKHYAKRFCSSLGC